MYDLHTGQALAFNYLLQVVQTKSKSNDEVHPCHIIHATTTQARTNARFFY